MNSFEIDGLKFTTQYNDVIGKVDGCEDEDGDYQACENCWAYGYSVCPITGGIND